MIQTEYTKIEPYRSRVEAAWQHWRELQTFELHPLGSVDSTLRWIPDLQEVEKCCKPFRTTSGIHSYAFRTHCRSYEHIALKYNVTIADLRHETERREKETRMLRKRNPSVKPKT